MESTLRCVSVGVLLAAMGIGCNLTSNEITRLEGPTAEIGGVVYSYALISDGQLPGAIGIAFSAEALRNLPTTASDLHHCFDANNDGQLEPETECSMWHERVIPLPSDLSKRRDIPFKWVLLNWNPHGHIPPGIYDPPHFDVHFFMEPIENVFSLRRGTCGPEFLQCDQFETATKPVPAQYVHADYQSVEAASPAMGNHLVDLTGPEFQGQVFQRSLIFGAYDGRITFWEEMVAREYMLSRPNNCFLIKQPQAVAQAGYYPTQSCVRYDAERDE
jgi:hypothetical protein